MAGPKLNPVCAIFVLLAILFCVALSGCVSKGAKLPKTIQVEIPIHVRPVPPEALVQCGKEPPDFRFYAVPGTNDIVILEQDQPKFQAWINRKNQCLQAWRNWAEPK